MIETFERDSRRFFFLKNDALSCILRISSAQLELLHLGLPVEASDAGAFVIRDNPGWGTAVKNGTVCLDSIPLAYSCSGTGDYRESPLELMVNGEPAVPSLQYKGFEILEGTQYMSLPQAEGSCETLRIELTGFGGEISLLLYFSLFETALTRRTVLVNRSAKTITVTKIMSAMYDLCGDFTMTTFDGGWISESQEHSVNVSYSKIVNESTTGFSSNRHNPGFLLSRGNTVYGFNLIYSGNHYSSASKSIQNLTRVVQGINYDNFARDIAPGESFETPEAIVCFSDKGFNGLRRSMHKFVNEHIVPRYWQYRQRPVIYNSWEGCMFNFNQQKLLKLARSAKNAGCELFVLDDGWFGGRNSDTAGLGDYDVNLTKLPEGLEGLSERIRDMGMEFGLWFEPEAVNPDSKLYRAHPEWAIDGNLSRNELLLDLRREDVRDYIVENVSSIIDKAGISYVKWDMNRHSRLLGNQAHDYILGLYDVLERIFKPRPQVLLESCASGGNRFDLGMLTFGPQIWASDNTDPIERLNIQQGLSYLYPQSCMGCHISASAHIQTLRQTPLSTRANVAFFGVLGIELELSHLLPVEVRELKDSVQYYKAHRNAFQFGAFSVMASEPGSVSWQVSNNDETLVGVFHTLVHAAQGYEWLRAEVPEIKSVYSVCSRPQSLRVASFSSMTKHILPVDLNPNGAVVRTADRLYRMPDGVHETSCTGFALKSGIPMNLKFTGTGYDKFMRNQGDFGSSIYLIKKKT